MNIQELISILRTMPPYADVTTRLHIDSRGITFLTDRVAVAQPSPRKRRSAGKRRNVVDLPPLTAAAIEAEVKAYLVEHPYATQNAVERHVRGRATEVRAAYKRLRTGA